MRFVLVVSSILLTGCAGGMLTRADQSVDNAKKQVDDSVDRATARIDQSVARASDRVDKSIVEARAEATKVVEVTRLAYADSLKTTGAEVDRLRTEVNKDLDDLDRKLQERLDQIRTSATALIAQGDKAAQDRIDQVFRELREFSSDTLKQVREMIEPIQRMATSISGTSDAATKAVERLLVRVEAMMDQVNKMLVEITNFVMKIQGKNPDGTKGSTDWAAIIATVVGVVGGVVGLLSKKNADQAKKKTEEIVESRANERARDGDRWKPEEIDQRIEEKMAMRLPQAGIYLPPVVPTPVAAIPDTPATTPDTGLDPNKGPAPANPDKEP